MQLHRHPDLLDRLAASYALGTLRGPARRRFETLTREQPRVRAAALVWQGHLSSLGELIPGVPPPSAVWSRIDNLMQAQRDEANMRDLRTKTISSRSAGWSDWVNRMSVWRAISAGCVLALLATGNLVLNTRKTLGDEIAQLQYQLQTTPHIGYVAVLSDAHAAASMLVTFDPRNNKLTLQRVGTYQEVHDRSLQLWGLPTSGAPKSMGVLGTDKVLELTALEKDVRTTPTLAISLEPLGGVAEASGPTGPVLFKGPLIPNAL